MMSGERTLVACWFRHFAETIFIQLGANCAVLASLVQEKFATRESIRSRQHATSVHSPDVSTSGCYSPTLRRKRARAYSRFSFAMKLALISAGQTASHS